MNTKHDADGEERTRRRYDALVRALEFDLVATLQAAGLELLGFSMSYGEWECLLTLRALQDEAYQVAFVASDTMTRTFIKAVNMGKRDKLVWKEDKYR